MDEAHIKGNETRKRLQAERAELYREQLRATRAARTALQRIFESEDATPEQILRAAELLAEIGK